MTTPLPLSTKVDGELWSLWLGDCSGWEIVCHPSELMFQHRCGYVVKVRPFYLANCLSKWFDERYHVC